MKCMNLLKEIMEDREFPRGVKATLEKYLDDIKNLSEDEIRSFLLDVLDQASNDPNIHPISRTKIWETISLIENMKK